MTLDRRTVVSVLLADVFVIAGAFFVMQDRLQSLKTNAAMLPVPAAAATAAKTKPAEPSAPAAEPAKPAAAPKSKQPTRNILFAYRNSKPARVDLVASFTNWSPKAMKKGKNFTWTFSAPLEPGDYTYNFIVDGKIARDPNNPRTAPEGRSLLTVKPLAQ